MQTFNSEFFKYKMCDSYKKAISEMEDKTINHENLQKLVLLAQNLYNQFYVRKDLAVAYGEILHWLYLNHFYKPTEQSSNFFRNIIVHPINCRKITVENITTTKIIDNPKDLENLIVDYLLSLPDGAGLKND